MSNKPTYLSNLLPRIKQFSKSLNQKELFVDKPWIMQDDLGNKIMYIFYRDNKIKIIYHTGRTLQGTWSYNIHVNRLFINDGIEEVALKQDFVEDGLMIMKIDDATSSPWIVVNEKIVPDLDIKKYVLTLLINKLNLYAITEYKGNIIYSNQQVENPTYYDSQINLLNTTVKYNNGKTVTYKNGKIHNFYYELNAQTNSGIILIRYCHDPYQIGNTVYLENKFAPDGVYKLENAKEIIVSNGKIAATKHTYWLNSNESIIILVGLLLLFIPIFYIYKKNKVALSDNLTKSTPLVQKDTLEKKVLESSSFNNKDVTASKYFRDTTNSTFINLQNNSAYKINFDVYNFTSIKLVTYFFNALSIGDCKLAWDYTNNPFWNQKGEEWFCSVKVFGAMRDINIKSIKIIKQEPLEEKVYVEFLDNEVLNNNGTNCFKQVITTKLFDGTDGKMWLITKMVNVTPPNKCTQ